MNGVKTLFSILLSLRLVHSSLESDTYINDVSIVNRVKVDILSISSLLCSVLVEFGFHWGHDWGGIQLRAALNDRLDFTRLQWRWRRWVCGYVPSYMSWWFDIWWFWACFRVVECTRWVRGWQGGWWWRESGASPRGGDVSTRGGDARSMRLRHKDLRVFGAEVNFQKIFGAQ